MASLRRACWNLCRREGGLQRLQRCSEGHVLCFGACSAFRSWKGCAYETVHGEVSSRWKGRNRMIFVACGQRIRILAAKREPSAISLQLMIRCLTLLPAILIRPSGKPRHPLVRCYYFCCRVGDGCTYASYALLFA